METILIYEQAHMIIIMQDLRVYDIFIDDNNGQGYITTVTGLQNALASVRAMIDNDNRLSSTATFLVKQKVG